MIDKFLKLTFEKNVDERDKKYNLSEGFYGPKILFPEYFINQAEISTIYAHGTIKGRVIEKEEDVGRLIDGSNQYVIKPRRYEKPFV